MKRPTDSQLISALQIARDGILQDKCGGFICNNLPQNQAGDYLVDFIAKAMTDDDGHEDFTLGNWLARHITGEDNRPSNADMKAYRLRWIDHMISQLES